MQTLGVQLYWDGLSCIRLPYQRTQQRIFNLGLPVRALGSASPSLLYDLVAVGVDPSVSP